MVASGRLQSPHARLGVAARPTAYIREGQTALLHPTAPPVAGHLARRRRAPMTHYNARAAPPRRRRRSPHAPARRSSRDPTRPGSGAIRRRRRRRAAAPTPLERFQQPRRGACAGRTGAPRASAAVRPSPCRARRRCGTPPRRAAARAGAAPPPLAVRPENHTEVGAAACEVAVRRAPSRRSTESIEPALLRRPYTPPCRTFPAKPETSPRDLALTTTGGDTVGHAFLLGHAKVSGVGEAAFPCNADPVRPRASLTRWPRSKVDRNRYVGRVETARGSSCLELIAAALAKTRS